MSAEQRIRALLYYLSVCIFFAGLPFILSSAFGYKFDRRTLKFTRTGLIVLKTQPQGAEIYLDNTLINDKTPTTIAELLPGKYTVELRLENHYSYSSEVWVEANKVARLEKVILFPLRPNVKKLNKELISNFWVDEAKSVIYYTHLEDNSIYKSDLEGGHFEKIAAFAKMLPSPKKWKLSPDKEKLLYFNNRQIGIVYLRPDGNVASVTEKTFLIPYSGVSINEVYWHSDSFHFILVGFPKIETLEAIPNPSFITLATVSKRDANSFYDLRSDNLYFIDLQRAADGKVYDNLFKLELSTAVSPLKDFMRIRANE